MGEPPAEFKEKARPKSKNCGSFQGLYRVYIGFIQG